MTEVTYSRQYTDFYINNAIKQMSPEEVRSINSIISNNPQRGECVAGFLRTLYESDAPEEKSRWDSLSDKQLYEFFVQVHEKGTQHFPEAACIPLSLRQAVRVNPQNATSRNKKFPLLVLPKEFNRYLLEVGVAQLPRSDISFHICLFVARDQGQSRFPQTVSDYNENTVSMIEQPTINLQETCPETVITQCQAGIACIRSRQSGNVIPFIEVNNDTTQVSISRLHALIGNDSQKDEPRWENLRDEQIAFYLRAVRACCNREPIGDFSYIPTALKKSIRCDRMYKGERRVTILIPESLSGESQERIVLTTEPKGDGAKSRFSLNMTFENDCI